MAQTSKEGQLDITQPLGSCGCLWKLRMINGIYHHSHLPLHCVEYNTLNSALYSQSEGTNHSVILLALNTQFHTPTIHSNRHTAYSFSAKLQCNCA